MTAEARRAARAVTAGVGEASLGLKSELRRQITGAGLGGGSAMARLAQVARPERLRGQQSRRDMLEGEVVIGLSVEQGIQPLKNGKLLFFQMTDHLRNELIADFPELDATAAAWPMPKDFGRDQPKALGGWFDRRVLPGEETGRIA